MSNERRATVLLVACETNDRSGPEQRAMLDEALYLDVHRGRFTISNREPVRPSLVALVRETYDPSEGRRVDLTTPQARQYAGLLARWEPCGRCGAPLGCHSPDGCPPPLTVPPIR